MDPVDEASARLDRFAGLVAGDPETLPLDGTVLAVAAVMRRGTDEPGAMATLDRLAAECGDRSFEGMRRHLFDHHGFQGDRRHYDDPRNSFLDVVLARQRGLPILLAVVMMEVGRRAGVPVAGIGMPMHFLVGDPSDPDRFADPFTGQALDRATARARFETLARAAGGAGGRMAWDEHHLDAIPARAIVVRILSNLRASYARRQLPLGLALVARLRRAIPELKVEVAAAPRASAVFN